MDERKNDEEEEEEEIFAKFATREVSLVALPVYFYLRAKCL